MKFNPAEKWTIARYGQTVASGQPGWELIGLPLATPEHGDEMTRPVAQPLKVREVSKHRAPGLYWVKFNPDEKWTIARYGLTVASGQPGWELIGLPFATRERGDEMTQPAA
ncbi:MAG: hypothetical protein ACKVP5_23855 [Aestuariivirga sp.]